jgi:hypothetical protein
MKDSLPFIFFGTAKKTQAHQCNGHRSQCSSSHDYTFSVCSKAVQLSWGLMQSWGLMLNTELSDKKVISGPIGQIEAHSESVLACQATKYARR